MKLWGKKVTQPAAKSLTIDQIIDRLESQMRSASGITVTPENAMQCPTVFAIVRVLSYAFSQLPVHIYKREGDTRELIPDHPMAKLLRRPNGWQTGPEYRSLLMTNLLLRGNYYAFKQRGKTGPIRALQPLHPPAVTTEQLDTLDLEYKVRFASGDQRTYAQDQIHHIRGLSMDGITGLSPVEQVRESIAISMAAEKMAASLFGNGAVPYVVLEHPSHFKDESAFQRFRKSWQEMFSLGSGGARGTAVLEDGLTIKTVQMNAVESQFIESRRFQKEEIAGAWGVPPHKLAMLERATFSNIEQQSLEFVTDCLMPYLVLIEAAMHRDLELADDEFVKFNVDGLLRGDIKSRSEALNIQRSAGVINANEWRAIEDMPPREGGDEYMTPLNMTSAQGDIPPEGSEE